MPRIATIYLTSIVCGFCMMALEIVGGRLLYPSFGSSVDVWAAIISVFILSLSVGYWGGGILADRMRSSVVLGYVVTLAAVFYLLLPIYARPAAAAIENVLQGTRFGSLPAAVVLFLPPSMLLGGVSPMLIRLAFTDAARVGRITGTLYAIGSLGNVLGVLVTNYLLLSHLSDNASIMILGGALAVVGLSHLALRMPVIQAQSSAGAA